MADTNNPPSSVSQSTQPTLSGFFYTQPPPIPPPISSLLQTYSGIPPPTQPAHILHVRDQAYKSHPYPCLGRFRFLNLELSTHPLYTTHILPLLKSPASELTPPHEPVFLDVGTCLGQDLRKLVFDGVDPERLYGSDLEWGYVETGYELFRDEDRFPRERFLVPGDVLGGESADSALGRVEGRCDVVSVSAVFHLFGLPEQERIAGRVVRLLRKDAGGRALVVGVQAGNVTAGLLSGRDGRDRYRHNMASWREMWDEVLGAEEWKGVVKDWEVGGRLEERDRFKGNKEGNGEDDSGVRWQVWWVWIGFQ